MDHKTWLWRKKSTEKIIVSSDNVNLSSKENEEEIQTLLNDKAELENDLKNVNDKLSSALSECNIKDELVKKHANTAQAAIAGWEKAKAEGVSLKQELDKALQQRVADEERSTQLDAALKECMQQLRFVRDEQEKRIHDAVMKASKEFEKSQMILEEKLSETSKRLAKIGVENTHFSKALLAKEKMIEDLSKQKTQAEADLNALMSRLDSTEKDNAALKYEVRVLEKELEIRNEEREFNRRTADASHKQHLESVKKIAKLESECQRLRLLVRKRLPGPASLAKMKNEVEILGRESVEMRRRRSNSSLTDSMVESAVDNSPDTPSKRINFLTEQLCALEEENKALKEALNKKINELQFSRTMSARTASKLSEVESQVEESSKGQAIMEPTRSSVMSHDLSLASMSDVGSDDKVSCSESWASALISELEHFRNGKQRELPSCKTVGASDINLMDDFVEMEKLAIVSVDKPSGSSYLSSDEAIRIAGPLETRSSGSYSEVTGGEMVPVLDSRSGLGLSNQELKSKDILIDKVPGWLQDILKVVLEQNRVTQKNPEKILEDIRVALAYINHPNPGEFVDVRESSDHPDTSNPVHVSGHMSSKPSDKSLVMDSSAVTNVVVSLTEKSSQQCQSDLSKSICRIIELIEGINLPLPDYGISEILSKKDRSFSTNKNSETPSGYMVRVLQWKTSELSSVLQQFVRSCYDLLNGKADLDRFAQELASALDWIMNHCFSLQDVSSMRDAIKKRFDWDESRSESEAEVGMMSQSAKADRLYLSREQLFTTSNGNNKFFHKEEIQYNVREENGKSRDDLINIKSTKKDLEGTHQSAVDKSESLLNQLQESEKTIATLQTELETMKKSKGMIEDQVENHKLMNEDLDTRLTVARVELNEARQKFSSLEAELDNKNSCCEELEATCLDLQLELESVTKKKIPNSELKPEQKQLRSDWEITAASEKLAECQETILNLGKQLKALASPGDAALFDKVISTPSDAVTTSTHSAVTTTSTTPAITPTPPKNKLVNQRSSLLDQMIAEDNAKAKDLESPKTKGSDGNSGSAFIPNGAIEPLEKILVLNGIKHLDNDVAVNSLAIVPRKKGGGVSLWKKLMWRKKKASSNRKPLPFAP